MTAKLTLSIDDGVIKRARLYAKCTGRNLSELIENYLETLAEEGDDREQLSSR